MKIHSIKFKITLLLVVTVTCLVAMLIGFNSIFSEKVYICLLYTSKAGMSDKLIMVLSVDILFTC